MSAAGREDFHLSRFAHAAAAMPALRAEVEVGTTSATRSFHFANQPSPFHGPQHGLAPHRPEVEADRRTTEQEQP